MTKSLNVNVKKVKVDHSYHDGKILGIKTGAENTQSLSKW